MKSSAQYMQLPLCPNSPHRIYISCSFQRSQVGPIVADLLRVSKTVLAPILVELTNEVIAIPIIDPAQVAGMRYPGFLIFDAGGPLLFKHNTYHHIQHRYVYPFVLFLFTVRQTAYLAIGTFDRTGSQDTYTHFQSGPFAST
jgi:hypothetical protein